jgi:threonine dehydrogenase-like Zn-dependent dehydrogenase
MKALAFESAWEMVVEDREIPVSASGEALIQVIATGVCGNYLHGYPGPQVFHDLASHQWDASKIQLFP